MKNIVPYFLLGFVGAVILYFMTYGLPKPTFLPLSAASLLIAEAEAEYQAGEKAATVAERKQHFNAALEKYLLLEKHNHPEFGNGKLYYNLANTNYQLGEFQWAVYYYYKALRLMPGDEEALHNLTLALKQLNLPGPSEESILHKIFFFHYHLSLPVRLMLFAFVGCLTFILASLLIWTHWRGVKTACILSALVSLILLGSLLYSRYLAPTEGVMVRSAMLYRDAGEQYAQVSDKPIPAGLKVEVLDIRQQGQWLKVLTPDGVLGYVQYEAIHLL